MCSSVNTVSQFSRIALEVVWKHKLSCIHIHTLLFFHSSVGVGLVQIDFQGHPIRYNELDVYDEVIAEGRAGCRLDLEVQTEGHADWRSVGSLDMAPGQHLWRKRLRKGAQRLREDTIVKSTDPHYDAKLFPHVHPYGTGSLFCEIGTGALQKHCRSRALALESWFRQSPLWCFWQLDMSIKKALFFKNTAQQRFRQKDASGDAFARAFGTVVPSTIPDSTAWWRRQAKDWSDLNNAQIN